MTDALNQITRFAYGTGCPSCGSGVDQLTSLTDAKGHTTAFEYNLGGKLIKETNPLGYFKTYTYDKAGNPATMTDEKNNITQYTYDQLNRLTQGREYRIDLGKVTLGEQVRYFVNIGGFGLSGQVNQILEQQKGSLGFLSGKAAFFLASLRGILTGKNAKVRLVIDGGPPVEMTSKLVALANGQFFGGGMWIAPQASNEDGWLDLVVLGDLSAWETLRQFPLVYQGLHLGRPGVLCQKITVLEASSEEPVWVDLDGEVVGQLPARFEVVRQGLKIWV